MDYNIGQACTFLRISKRKVIIIYAVSILKDVMVSVVERDDKKEWRITYLSEIRLIFGILTFEDTRKVSVLILRYNTLLYIIW